jgi:subtilisin family serine protease
VFVCGRPGRQPVIPQISAINPGPALAAGPVSALAMNTPPPNSAGDAAPPAQQQPQAQQAPALPQFVPDQVLVTVPRTVPQTVDSDVAQSFGLQLLGQWALDLIDTRLVLYRISDGREVPAVVALLQGDARVTGPQPNFYYRPQAASEQSAEPVEDLQYALVKLDIDHAQSIARGRDVLVAVIDTEIDATHPDLAGAVIEKFDATDGNKPAPGDHGTSIAGIIRAHGVMRGIAPEAKLLGISAFASTGGEGASPAATTASLLRGMDWALTKRARIINMSFTGPRDTLLEQGIQAAARRKAILVAAAGNAGPGAPEAFPAAYPEVIAVTATDVADHLYVSANQGAYIDVAAPGVDVLAPGLEHAHILQSGTSFAAAHISGIVALMLELNPDLTSDDARDALMNGARDLGPPGQDEQFGAGRADAFAALQLID